MAFDALNITFVPTLAGNAAANKQGNSYQQVQLTVSQRAPQVSVGTNVANNLSGGGDQLALRTYTIAASGTLTLDLTNIIDAIERSAALFARIKMVGFFLLGTADDSAGTACSSVTIGNAGSNAQKMFMTQGTYTFDLQNGECVFWATRQALGRTVDGTHKNVLITNNDGSNSAALQVMFAGGST